MWGQGGNGKAKTARNSTTKDDGTAPSRGDVGGKMKTKRDICQKLRAKRERYTIENAVRDTEQHE